MSALFAGLSTVDVLHALDHEPDPTLKTTSTDFLLAAGGPATNAAATYAALDHLATLGCLTTVDHQVTVADQDTTAPVQGAEKLGAVASSTGPKLLTALGSGALSQVIREDLATCGVSVLDATAHTDAPSPQCDAPEAPERSTPAVSSIVDHPGGRMVASTNARVPVSGQAARMKLADCDPSALDVILVDGHNPELAIEALTLGRNTDEDHHPGQVITVESQVDSNSEQPEHTSAATALRILDGGSWKPWLMPLLQHIDIAVISADFIPPLCHGIDPETTHGEQSIVDFLRGCGITKVVRTRGPHEVHWWWDDEHGSVPVPTVEATSTLGAGDIFHGAFAWALARHPHATPQRLIAFASTIAATSTTLFGTRSWMRDPQVAQAVDDFLADAQTAPGVLADSQGVGESETP